MGTLLHLDAEPTWIRLVYVNDGPEPWTVDAAAVAATSALGDGFVPVSADGQADQAGWRPVTFASGGRDSQPDLRGDAAAQTSLVVPGTPPGHDGVPVHVLSDWMPVKTLPRQDGGPGWLLQVRTFSHGAMRFAASVGRPDPAIGRLHRGFWVAGDATRGGTDQEPTPADRMFACHGVQFLSPVAGATVIGIGDSIIASSCTTGEMSGFGIRACAKLSRPGFPVSYVNEGFPGRNSFGFASTGLWAIETLRPQVAIIAPWSQNEPWTAAMADLSFARAVALMDAARRNGCAPILTTTAPVFQDHPDADEFRRATNERIRAAGRNGVPVLDIDALWGTGATPNTYRPGYDCGDHTHPNDRACAAAADVLAPMLRRLLEGC